MFDELTNSLPPITDALTPERRAFFESLPRDYREFLEKHNGGFAEEFRLAFATGVPGKSREDCVVELLGLNAADSDSSEPGDLQQLRLLHDSEEFLPRDIVAIARCVTSSLVCVSLRDEDRGAIYYWNWYWRYPWNKEFFEARIEQAQARFADAKAILSDSNHPNYGECYDAFNFATLVKLADSFTAWAARCYDGREST